MAVSLSLHLPIGQTGHILAVETLEHEALIAEVLAFRLLADHLCLRTTGATVNLTHTHNKTEAISTMQAELATHMRSKEEIPTLNKEGHSQGTVDGSSMVEELRMDHMVS